MFTCPELIFSKKKSECIKNMPLSYIILEFLILSVPGISEATIVTSEFRRILNFNPDASGINREEHRGIGKLLCAAICSTDEDCTGLLMDQQNKSCLVLHGYLATADSTQSAEHVYLKREIGCIGGWLKRNDKCYLPENITATWPIALNNCRNLGTQASLSQTVHLAEPKDEAENTYLSFIAHGPCWIGGSDGLNEGRWIYSSNGAVMSFTKWKPNEPSGGTNQNCALLLTSSFWNDRECTDQRLYVCEYTSSVTPLVEARRKV